MIKNIYYFEEGDETLEVTYRTTKENGEFWVLYNGEIHVFCPKEKWSKYFSKLVFIDFYVDE